MTSWDNTPITLPIGKLLDATDMYVIPLYQRNYAWTNVEITQLLKDVEGKQADDPGGNYFIGTLVVFRKPDTTFEIIDGQQRFTTLSLIHAVIKSMSDDRYGNARSNLLFESRKETGDYIGKLFYDYTNARAQENDTKHSGLLNIIKAVKDIECYLKALQKRNVFDGFVTYLYKNVQVIRVGVPDGTDINRYFEIMNNRGEQLEFHEILKAAFIGSIKSQELEIEFAEVWNNCSQMNRHIQMCFQEPRRKEVFGANYDRIPFNCIVVENRSESGVRDDCCEGENSTHSLEYIINSHNVKDGFPQDTKGDREGNYESIIDFSNFLLHVLKLEKSDVSLDDKKLLDEFGYNTREMPNAINFVNKLLYYRTLFDKYIIKRGEGTEDWKFCILSPHAGRDGVVYSQTKFTPNTAVDSDDDSDDSDNPDENSSLSLSYDNLCMLQSMLHVTYPNKSYKHWLYDLMSTWKPDVAADPTTGPTAKCIFKALNDTCVRNYLTVIEHGIDLGTSTERFIFNYLDYILWVKYRLLRSGAISDETGLSAVIKNRKALFDSFKFRQNNSVEHLHPQCKKDELDILVLEHTYNQAPPLGREEILNCFGNLCLISRESNSKYNDYNFHAKREQFEKRKYVESLKQVIMFGYEKGWNTHEIMDHRKEMIALIEKYTNDPEAFLAGVEVLPDVMP